MQSLPSAPSSEKSWSLVIEEASMKTTSEITQRKGTIFFYESRAAPLFSSPETQLDLWWYFLSTTNQEKTTLYIKEYRTFNVVLVPVKSGSLANFFWLWEGVKKLDFFQEKS